MTALTVNGSAVAATTLAAAGKLFNTTGGTSGNTSTKVGTSTQFKQIFATGTTINQTGVASIPAPTDSNFSGWMWDVTTLEGQRLAAGTFTPTIHLLASTGTTVTPTVAWYKRSSGGVYTSIGSVAGSSIALTTTSQALTFTPPSLALMDFATGDKLVMWLWVNQTAGGATNSTISVVEATSGSSAGVTSEAQTVTPGYAPPPVALSVTMAGTGTLTGTFSLWYNTAYQFKKQLVIDHTKVSGGSDLSNFPMLISMTDANLKTAGNGGNVQNASGFDIIFVDSTETTKLDHEIEQYVGATGEIEMWVRIPTLSASVDTIIYIYYGGSTIGTSQENKTGVWDSNYKGVWHLKESGNGTASEFKDSTSNANHGNGGTSATCPDQTTGQIGKGQSFVRANLDTIVIPNAASLNFTTTLTLSAWFKSNSTNTGVGNPVYLSKGNWEYSIGNTGAIELDTWENNATNLTGGTLSISWVYVTWTLDSVGNHSIGYVNGSQVFSTTAVAVTTSTNTITMGHVSGFATTPNTLDGILDEVRASNSVRTAGWIATEYNNQSTPATFYSVGSQLSQGITFGVTLAGVGTLAGTIGESTALTSTINGVGTLSGTISKSTALITTLPGVGTLTAAYTYSQTAALYGYAYYAPTFYLSYATSLTTTLVGMGTLSGTLSTSGGGVALAGACNGVGTFTGTISRTTALSTTLAGVGTLSATPSPLTTALTAILPGVGTLSETFTLTTALTTTLSGVGTLSGTLSAALTMPGASLVGVGTLSSTLTETTALTVTIGGTSALTGTFQFATSLSTTIAGIGTLTGTAGLATSLTGTIPGRGVLTGVLGSTAPVALSGTLSGIGTLSGSPVFTIFESGTLAGVGTLSLGGALQLATNVTASIPGIGHLTGALAANMTLPGVTFAGVGTIAGTISESTALVASIPGVGTLTGTATFALQLATVTLAGVGTLTGVESLGTTLAGAFAGVGTLTGATPTLKTALTSTLPGVGILTAALTGAGALTGTCVGTGTLSSAFTLATALSVSANGAGTLSGTLHESTALAVTLVSSSQVSAQVQLQTALGASVNGMGTVAFTLSLGTSLTVSLSGVGTLTSPGLSERTSLALVFAASSSLSGHLIVPVLSFLSATCVTRDMQATARTRDMTALAHTRDMQATSKTRS